MKVRKSAVRCAVFLLFVAPVGAEAQSLWLPREPEPWIAVEGLKPFFDGGGLSFFSTAWFVSGRLRTGNTVVLVGEIPFAFASFDDPFFRSESDAAVGNIYFGAEFGSQSSPAFLELGVRAPLSPENTAAFPVGTFTDLDRWEAFVPNLVPVSLLGNYYSMSEHGLVLRFRGGGIVWVPTETGPDTELLALLNAQVGFQRPDAKFGVLGGLTSRITVTTSGSFSERSAFQAGANGWFALGRVRPGILFLVPLDSELRDIVSLTVGLNAQILLN